MNKKKIYSLSYSNTLNPAPYLYKLDLHFNFTDQGVYLKYNKHFLNREDFSEDELEEEGFSTNDDVQIESTLSPAWTTYFKQLKEHPKWTADKPSEDIGNTLSLNTTEDESIKYLTLNKVEYLLEEVYQAILETAKIEAPLSLYLKKVHKGIDKTVELIWHFKDRLFEVIHNEQKNTTPWEEGQEWLFQFYETDLGELSVHKKKLPEGKVCINPGDGLWYETPNDKNWEKILLTLFPN
ncbi:MAG: hypothetical protein JWO58_1791 [Chitinophagaceae bacterium]|nr:hypothetical protein [Chitinophagaceae bacterium]